MIRFAIPAALAALLILPALDAPAHAQRAQTGYDKDTAPGMRQNSRPRRERRTQRTAPAASGERTTPDAAPTPEPNPQRDDATAPDGPTPLPIEGPPPETHPREPGDEVAKPAEEPTPPEQSPQAPSLLPATTSAPEPKPGTPADDVQTAIPTPKPAEPPAAADAPKETGKPGSPAPASAAMPPEELACRSRLKSLGAAFTDRPAEGDASGCSMPHPVLVTRVSAGVALEPGALMNCATAEATARFTRDVIVPMGRRHMGDELKSLSQASAYVCRPRNGTQTLSEHAFGNAVDLVRFVFTKGGTVDVGPVPGEKGEDFLRAIRDAACGPFKTVLGPGSDADHATHLHLDLQQRSNGGTFCQ